VTGRRYLIAAAAALSLHSMSLHAQSLSLPVRVGMLTLSIPQESSTYEAFRRGLRDLGYGEGTNVVILYRYANGQPDRLAAMAKELVDARVDIIVTESVQAAREAQRATNSVPIVTAVHGDPVGAGLARSLARPGGNVTGLSLLAPELSGKRIQLLREIAPKAATIGVLWNPGNPAAVRYLDATKGAAQSLGLVLVVAESATPEELDGAFRTLAAAKLDALVSLPDGMLLANRVRIVEFAARQRIPAVYPDEEFAVAGGLVTYGPSLAANFHGAAAYVDKIVKGMKPSDIPIDQPRRFDLVINMKTARTLGLAMPRPLVQGADRIIN
jgi:putative ABC transport system substrate-binding protein